MSKQLSTQLLRFARLFVAALLAQLAMLGTNHLGWKVLAGAVVGAVEVVFRQLYPGTPPPPAAVPAHAATPVSPPPTP